MSLRNEVAMLDAAIKSETTKNWIHHNYTLLDIFEGNLLQYVEQDLKAQLTPVAFESAKYRIAAINILKKLVDKLSQVYETNPVRTVLDVYGDDAPKTDQEAVQWYEKQFKMNEAGVQANEYLNLKKCFAYEPYLDRRKPRLRVMPADSFFVYSNDANNPMNVTHFVKLMGKVKDAAGKERELRIAYTDTEIVAFYEGGEVADDVMSARRMDGKNPYGKIPFVYCARSKVRLIPTIDTDTLSMTKLIPVLLTDLGYAVMYQSFSIVWTLDASIEGVRAPNAILQLTTDPTKQNSNPSVGSIKPEVDIDRVLTLIQTMIVMWMDSRNIKPGAMGKLDVQNAASGIAKMIDEMDTSADRKKQVPFLKTADQSLFELVLNHMHPVWMRTVGFEKPFRVSRQVTVDSKFGEQRPLVDPSQAILDQKAQMDAGLQSRRGALIALNPDWTDKQVDERLAEIDAEKAAAMAANPQPETKPEADVVETPEAKPTDNDPEDSPVGGAD